MQRTTVLRAADGSLENTFQPASHRMTANESAAGKVSSAPEKSRNHCALMWTCPAAKYSQILRCLITRRLRCYLLLSVRTRLKSHMMTGEHFTPPCNDDEEEAVHCVDVTDQRLCATLHTYKVYSTNKTRMCMCICVIEESCLWDIGPSKLSMGHAGPCCAAML